MDCSTPIQIRVFAWATPQDGMTVDDLVAHLRDTGNQVLEIDYEQGRVKVADITERIV